MQQKKLTIVNKLGLHARAAAKFVKIASSFPCEISVYAGHKEVSGKSIMGVMMLAAGKGSVIEIRTSGAKEETAMIALENLINDKFGEGE